MARQLTKKQRGFVKDYIKTGNGTKAALKNYDINGKHGTTNPENVAHAIATENLLKPSIILALKDAIPDDLLTKVHLEGLQATKRSGTGGMMIGIGKDGKVNDVGHTDIDEPDYAVRHKYLDTAYKIKKLYGDENPKGTTVNNLTQINIHNASEPRHLPDDQTTPGMDGVTEPEHS